MIQMIQNIITNNSLINFSKKNITENTSSAEVMFLSEKKKKALVECRIIGLKNKNLNENKNTNNYLNYLLPSLIESIKITDDVDETNKILIRIIKRFINFQTI